MPKLKIQNFGGEVPRQSDTMLKDTDASFAENVRLYSGELRTWDGPTFEFDPVTDVPASLYRFTNPTTDASVWLTWTQDVDVQRSALDDTTDFRLYYTGADADGLPKKTNWAMASDASAAGEYPGDYLLMGVPAPAAAATVADTAGGSSLAAESRYYVYTYVSTFGTLTEESAPSPASAIVSIAASRKVTINGFETVPTGSGRLNITHRNIYRTLPGEKSDGAFVFVAQIAVGTTSYVDDLLATQLGEPLTTTGWDEPPDGLKGLTSMANGMMAGFVGNSVYFCEPYFHHAWPAAYIQSVPDQIVGLGSYGNTLVVLTEGQPWAMVGVSPDQITVEKISMPEPCVSKKSIASDAFGVLYASPNGIVGIGPQVRAVITNNLFRRKEWQDFAPLTMVGTIYDGKYFGSFESTPEGERTMVISRDDFPALSFLNFRASRFFTDVAAGDLYYIDPADEKIYLLDDDTSSPLLYQWISKRFVFGRAITWSALRVDVSGLEISDVTTYNELVAAISAENAAIVGSTYGEINGAAYGEYGINASLLQDIPPPASSKTCSLLLIGEDDIVKASLTINTFNTYRIPAFKSRELRVQLTGNLSVRSVALATSYRELVDE